MATKIFTAGPESVLGRHLTYVLIEREQREDEAQPPPADKQVVGYVGINQVYPSPEIGYSIHPDYWGKGYATEALDGLLEKINPGSSKVLSKCRFRVIKQILYDEDELVLWELERPALTHTCP